MIRRFVSVAALCLAALFGAERLVAATYTLTTGETVEGEPISFNAQGMVVKRPDGSFAPRVAWTNLAESAMKELIKNPKAKTFVEPFVEPEEPESAKKRVEINPKPVPRLDRPDRKAGFGALFSSPLSITLFLLLYAGNIYAAFEISILRNYSPALVCGVAAVAPVLGPVIFLSIPTRVQKSHNQIGAESMAQHLSEAEQHALEEAQAQAGPGTPIHGAEQPATAEEKKQTQIAVFQRGQTTFNRRFFETKFAGFLRMVPGEAERNKVIYVKSARGEHVGGRISRIQPNEIHLQVTKAGATSDVIIPFAEIYEVQVRPREA